MVARRFVGRLDVVAGLGNGVAEIAGTIARPPRCAARTVAQPARSRRRLASVGLAGRENEVARNLPYGDQRRLESPAPSLRARACYYSMSRRPA